MCGLARRRQRKVARVRAVQAGAVRAAMQQRSSVAYLEYQLQQWKGGPLRVMHRVRNAENLSLSSSGPAESITILSEQIYASRACNVCISR